MPARPRFVTWSRWATEGILLALAALAPWAYGAVDAWAQLGLDVGILVLAVLGVPAAWGGSRAQRLLTSLPSLALAGLVGLALVQAAPLPRGLLGQIDSSAQTFRNDLLPGTPTGVRGDAEGTALRPWPATISEDPDATLRTALQLAAAWVLLQAVLGLGGDPASLRRFAIVTGCNASALAVYSIVQALTWNGKIYGIRAVAIPVSAAWSAGGPFVCHSHLAAYLNIGIGCALGLVAGDWLGDRTRRDPQRWDASHLWPAYIAGVCAAGVITSHSRGGLLALLAATTVTAALMGRRALRLAAGAGVILVLAGLFLAAVNSASPFARIATIADPGARGYALRLEIWTGALRAWKDHPVFGTGLGTFPVSTAPYYTTDHSAFYSHAENEYVQMLVEGGLLGFGLALLALAGLVHLGLRALAAANSTRHRGLIFGGLFGAWALTFQLLSDFTLHIPGVAVTAVVLFGHLGRLGLAARPGMDGRTRVALPLAVVRGLAMIGLAAAACLHGAQLARAEALVRSVGLPWPGSEMPAAALPAYTEEELGSMRKALEQAVRLRPRWVEGHWRLGSTLLGLYQVTAERWLVAGAQPVETSAEETEKNRAKTKENEPPAVSPRLADPLWLHRVVHGAEGGLEPMVAEVLEFDPVRDYLLPAARSFLEARRCCPALAIPHLRLAELDYLVAPSEPSAVHAARALKLAGPHADLLLRIGEVAAHAGDRSLAARAWRRALEAREVLWPLVADAAGEALAPEQILAEVLPLGTRFPIYFADRLYSGDADQVPREQFLRTALERMPRDPTLDEPGRLWLEGQIRARLDERDKARRLMEEALSLDPLKSDWRQEFVLWLIAWGDAETAHRQALAGTQIDPGHKGLQLAFKESLNAIAQYRPAAAAAPTDIGGREAPSGGKKRHIR